MVINVATGPYGSYYNPYQYGKKKTSIPTFEIGDSLTGFESLTPNQQTLSDSMVKALQGAMASYGTGGNAGGFKASYAKPFSPYGGAVGGALENALVGMLTATPEQYSPYTGKVGESLESALLTALSGKVPTEAFQTGVAQPARRTFEQETAPAIREEFAGPGTFWGTARAGEVTGERANMETGLVEQSARMVEGALERALAATPTALNAQQYPMTTALTARQGAVSPALNAQQISIQTALQEYARNNPGASEALQAALSYLGIPMLAAYQPYE